MYGQQSLKPIKIIITNVNSRHEQNSSDLYVIIFKALSIKCSIFILGILEWLGASLGKG